MAIKKHLVSVYGGGGATATSTPTPTPATKTNEDIATEVISGKWGNGADRKNQLTSAGYDYAAVQQIVDNRLSSGQTSKQSAPAESAPAESAPTVSQAPVPVVTAAQPTVSVADLVAQWKEQATVPGVTAAVPNTNAADLVAKWQEQATVPGVTAAQPTVSGADLAAQWKEQMPNVDADALANQWKEHVPDVNKAKSDQMALLEQWKNTLLEQNNNQIDYNVAKAITELERALQDAQPQFKEQQESIAKDEVQAKDNAALYAEARGDKGGIGQEQYNSIMNTAAQNRLSVQQAQTKLATDTRRQIADLRAQGEFDKADAALEISQQYLSQLMSLEQWAFEAGMTAAQFKVSLDQWAADYKMAMAQFATGLDQWAAEYDSNWAQYQTSVDQWNKEFALNQQQYKNSLDQWAAEYDFNKAQYQTGVDQWNAEFAYNQQQNTNSSLASSGTALLEAGIMPSASQLAAMHMTSAQAQEYIAAAKLAQVSGGGYTGGGGYNNTGGGDKWASVVDWVNKYGEDAAEDYIKEHYKDLGYSSQSAALSGWNNYLLSSDVEIKYNGGYAKTITPPDYETIRRNSEAGLYGPKFAVVLTMVQAQWSAKKTNEEIAEYLNAELDKGSINEYGAAAIMQALGM